MYRCLLQADGRDGDIEIDAFIDHIRACVPQEEHTIMVSCVDMNVTEVRSPGTRRDSCSSLPAVSRKRTKKRKMSRVPLLTKQICSWPRYELNELS